jgi:hypothetical protein
MGVSSTAARHALQTRRSVRTPAAFSGKKLGCAVGNVSSVLKIWTSMAVGSSCAQSRAAVPELPEQAWAIMASPLPGTSASKSVTALPGALFASWHDIPGSLGDAAEVISWCSTHSARGPSGMLEPSSMAVPNVRSDVARQAA